MGQIDNVCSQKSQKKANANLSGPWILLFVPKFANPTSLNMFQNCNRISKIQLMAILMSKLAQFLNKKAQLEDFYCQTSQKWTWAPLLVLRY